ncbi:MAG: hypothetical protein IPI46_04895 [Bacteroidetes bacterium]|nr:hypothetical protein [Bacteroidota bacterium]
MKKIILLAFIICFQQSAFAQAYRTKNNSKSTGDITTSAKKERGNPNLGKNIFAFSPIQILLTHVDQTSPDLAINASYERIFDNQLFSFRLPVCVSLLNNYYYFLPTLKIYPFKQGMVKYAVGPQLLYAFGTLDDERTIYNPNVGYILDSTSYDRKQFGFLINNSLNITMAKSLYFGIDASLGIIYYDNLPNNYYQNYYNVSPLSGGNSGISPAFQFHFNAGYRF